MKIGFFETICFISAIVIEMVNGINNNTVGIGILVVLLAFLVNLQVKQMGSKR